MSDSQFKLPDPTAENPTEASPLLNESDLKTFAEMFNLFHTKGTDIEYTFDLIEKTSDEFPIDRTEFQGAYNMALDQDLIDTALLEP